MSSVRTFFLPVRNIFRAASHHFSVASIDSCMFVYLYMNTGQRCIIYNFYVDIFALCAEIKYTHVHNVYIDAAVAYILFTLSVIRNNSAALPMSQKKESWLSHLIKAWSQ